MSHNKILQYRRSVPGPRGILWMRYAVRLPFCSNNNGIRFCSSYGTDTHQTKQIPRSLSLFARMAVIASLGIHFSSLDGVSATRECRSNDWVDIRGQIRRRLEKAYHARLCFLRPFVRCDECSYSLVVFWLRSRSRLRHPMHDIETNTKHCFLHEAMAMILRSNPGNRAIANVSKRNRPEPSRYRRERERESFVD